LEWRHVFLWKDSTVPQDGMTNSIDITEEEEEGGVEEEGGEKEEVDPNVGFDKVVPKNVFLSTIRIFKYTNDSKPDCVKEILCENNINPAMDYGPSVAYFGKCLYYFKREVKS